jgi:hypothetical protein
MWMQSWNNFSFIALKNPHQLVRVFYKTSVT